jgi:hypothetical protein
MTVLLLILNNTTIAKKPTTRYDADIDAHLFNLLVVPLFLFLKYFSLSDYSDLTYIVIIIISFTLHRHTQSQSSDSVQQSKFHVCIIVMEQ